MHGDWGWSHLADERGLAWDTVGAWLPGTRWSHEVPAPVWSGAPVVDAAPAPGEWLEARRSPDAATRALLDRLLRVHGSDAWAAAEALSQQEYQPVVAAIAAGEALSSAYPI